MAFAGMFIAAIFIVIAIIVFTIALIELIVGIVLMCKKKKVPAIILFVLAAIPVIITVISVSVYMYKQNHPQFETYDGGTVTLNMRDVNKMMDLLRAKDMDGLDKLLDKHPDLIYYQDINRRTLLEFGVESCSVEVMEIAYDHGARFDEPTVFDGLIYDYSLEAFADENYWNFLYSYNDEFEPWLIKGETTDEVIDALKFAVEHGAKTDWDMVGGWTFADRIREWAKSDGNYTAKDRELVQYAKTVS